MDLWITLDSWKKEGKKERKKKERKEKISTGRLIWTVTVIIVIGRCLKFEKKCVNLHYRETGKSHNLYQHPTCIINTWTVSSLSTNQNVANQVAINSIALTSFVQIGLCQASPVAQRFSYGMEE